MELPQLETWSRLRQLSANIVIPFCTATKCRGALRTPALGGPGGSTRRIWAGRGRSTSRLCPHAMHVHHWFPLHHSVILPECSAKVWPGVPVAATTVVWWALSHLCSRQVDDCLCPAWTGALIFLSVSVISCIVREELFSFSLCEKLKAGTDVSTLSLPSCAARSAPRFVASRRSFP